MSLAVRAASFDDIPALIASDPFAQTSPQRRTLIAEWTNGGQCFLGELDGGVSGYVVLTRAFFHSFFIEMLAVHGDERRSGIGTALVQFVIDLVPPGEKLWTSTNESNAPMRQLLVGLGFVESGRIDNLDEDDPELIFVRLPD